MQRFMRKHAGEIKKRTNVTKLKKT